MSTFTLFLPWACLFLAMVIEAKSDEPCASIFFSLGLLVLALVQFGSFLGRPA
jgi:hypothetical protein